MTQPKGPLSIGRYENKWENGRNQERGGNTLPSCWKIFQPKYYFLPLPPLSDCQSENLSIWNKLEKNLSLSIGIKVSKFGRRVYIRVCIYVCSWRQRPNTSKIINARPGQIKYSRSDKIKREKPRDKIKTSAATVS